MSTLLAAPAWVDYAAGSRIEHFEWWCREHCRQVVGRWAGQPLMLEPWQHEWMGEGLAVDPDELPFWSTVVGVVPRKNGKSTSTGALACYFASEDGGLPNIGLAATSNDQAGELFGAVDTFVKGSPALDGRFHVRDYEGEIARVDALAYIRRMSMDWRRLHGKNLSKLFADELHAWSTPNLRRCWEALTTGDGARPEFQAWGITTEGEDIEGDGSILTELVTSNEQFGQVEERPGLTISRNFEARVLVYRFSAPMPAADPRPVREAYGRWKTAERAGAPTAALEAEFEAAAERCAGAAKLANPSSWITTAYLRRKALDGKISRASFLRYHACVKASDDEAWLDGELWDALGREVAPEVLIPSGTAVDVGGDGSRTHDGTAIAWARMAPDGVVDVHCRVFSPVKEGAYHELARVPAGHLDYARVRGFVEGLPHKVLEVAYDPSYLDTTMDHLVETLPEAAIFSVKPGSAPYVEALQVLDQLIAEGRVRHCMDPVIRAHMTAARAVRDSRSNVLRNLVKPDQGARRIDAVHAIALAVWRASRRKPAARSWRPR